MGVRGNPLGSPRLITHYSILCTNVRLFVPEQVVEFLVGGVSHATPSSSIKVLPESSEADGQPLLEERVRLLELRQTKSYHIVLETNLLQYGMYMYMCVGGGRGRDVHVRVGGGKGRGVEGICIKVCLRFIQSLETQLWLQSALFCRNTLY